MKEQLYTIDANRSIQDEQGLVEDLLKHLELDRYKQRKQLMDYMNNKVDLYIQSLIKYILQRQPDDVFGAIQEWVGGEGAKIKPNL